ncbi:hypothetical protein DFJ74DRAFT_770790, partial [Hyaloraphidium curvatum]
MTTDEFASLSRAALAEPPPTPRPAEPAGGAPKADNAGAAPPSEAPRSPAEAPSPSAAARVGSAPIKAGDGGGGGGDGRASPLGTATSAPQLVARTVPGANKEVLKSGGNEESKAVKALFWIFGTLGMLVVMGQVSGRFGYQFVATFRRKLWGGGFEIAFGIHKKVRRRTSSAFGRWPLIDRPTTPARQDAPRRARVPPLLDPLLPPAAGDGVGPPAFPAHGLDRGDGVRWRGVFLRVCLRRVRGARAAQVRGAAGAEWSGTKAVAKVWCKSAQGRHALRCSRCGAVFSRLREGEGASPDRRL